MESSTLASPLASPSGVIPVLGQFAVTGEMDLRSLHTRLADLGRSKVSPREMLQEIGQIITAATGAHHVAWYGRLPFDPLPEPRLHILASSLPEATSAVDQVLTHLARESATRQAPCTKLLPKTSWAQLAAVPIPHWNDQAIVALLHASPQGSAPSLLVLELAATRLALSWYEQDAEVHYATAQRLATLTELLARLESASDLEVACQVLCDSLAESFSVRQVIVGLCASSDSSCQVKAISGVDSFDTKSELISQATALLDETIGRGELTVWPSWDEAQRFALAAHRQYAQLVSASQLVSLPLRTVHGETIGAVLLVDAPAITADSPTVAFLQAATSPVAAALGLQRRADHGWLISALTDYWQLLKSRRGAAALVVLSVAVGFLFLPYSNRVKCSCTVEPVFRRYVSAPFNGALEKAFVQPGDLVTKGQLLAKMDGKEIHWELAGGRAELQRATKERAGYVAEHDSGKAKVAEHEVARLTVRTQLLEERAAHLELRSPIDGVVVSGDMTDSDGMPLETGRPLFEIAPLDRMEVELQIPEGEVATIQPGMDVTIWFDAFPHKKITAQVRTIHPRAEILDDQNVFVAEVPLDAPDLWLRPGMRGTARIDAGHESLGWILFHRPYGALLRWMGW